MNGVHKRPLSILDLSGSQSYELIQPSCIQRFLSLDIVSTVDPRETRQQEVKEDAGAAVVFSRLKSEEMAFCSGDILDEPVASAGKSLSRRLLLMSWGERGKIYCKYI